MDYMTCQRFEKLERRVAILEGKPDPGVTCSCIDGTDEGALPDGRWGVITCSKCYGTKRLYPSLDN